MAATFDRHVMGTPKKLVRGAVEQLKKILTGQIDPTPLLRAPSTYLAKGEALLRLVIVHEVDNLREIARRVANELESRPGRILALYNRSAKVMAKGLVSDLPEAEPWLEYFRALETQFPGSVVLAFARSMVRIAGSDGNRLPQILARIPSPLPGTTEEETARRNLDWLGRVIEGVFAPVALDALAFVESIRTGKRYCQQEIRGAQHRQVKDSLGRVSGLPELDRELFDIRNAIEHDSFSCDGRAFLLRSRPGQKDWSLTLPFDAVEPKVQEVLRTTMAIMLAMQVVMVESGPALLLQPPVVKVLVAALRGLDPSPYDAEAEAAFTGHLAATFGQLSLLS